MVKKYIWDSMQKYNKYEKQYEKDQQTIKTLDEFYRKGLQDNLTLKTNMNLYVLFSLGMLMKLKNEFFWKKLSKTSFFISIRLKINLEPRT